MFARHGHESGITGIRKTEELVARTRDQVGAAHIHGRTEDLVGGAGAAGAGRLDK